MPGFEVIGKEEQAAVNQIFIDGGVLFSHGFDSFRKNYHVREFEELFAEKFSCEYALAVSSGTAAIKVALKSIGVQSGDEVITQAFNFIATIEAILDTGAVPIIANVDDSLNMDVTDCESLITNKTKAILPVHMLGVPANMNSILALAEEYNLKVLEDNCESVGAKYNGNYLGTISDVGAISFDFGKVITSGEGGMILTDNPIVDKYAREYHDHGHENNPKFPRGRDTKSIYGFNYRMTEMQAAVGKVQLNKLDWILRENKKRYEALANAIHDKCRLRLIPSGSEIIYDSFIFFIENKNIRRRIIDHLIKAQFGTKILPDALEWHCAAYWDHALPVDQLNRVTKTKEKLAEVIVVPIWLRKSIQDYHLLGKTFSDYFR